MYVEVLKIFNFFKQTKNESFFRSKAGQAFKWQAKLQHQVHSLLPVEQVQEQTRQFGELC